MSRKARAPHCPVDGLLRDIAGPWTTYLLWLLQRHGALRFGQIKALLPDISAKVLTERLRHLEAAGLVSRDYQPTIPPAVSYALTERGLELKAALSMLGEIAVRWAQEDALAGDAVAVDAPTRDRSPSPRRADRPDAL